MPTRWDCRPGKPAEIAGLDAVIDVGQHGAGHGIRELLGGEGDGIQSAGLGLGAGDETGAVGAGKEQAGKSEWLQVDSFRNEKVVAV